MLGDWCQTVRGVRVRRGEMEKLGSGHRWEKGRSRKRCRQVGEEWGECVGNFTALCVVCVCFPKLHRRRTCQVWQGGFSRVVESVAREVQANKSRSKCKQGPIKQGPGEMAQARFQGPEAFCRLD